MPDRQSKKRRWFSYKSSYNPESSGRSVSHKPLRTWWSRSGSVVQPSPAWLAKVDVRPPYRIVSGQSDEWRLLFFVRLAIKLLTAGSQAADGAAFQLFASRSKKQIPIISSFPRAEPEDL